MTPEKINLLTKVILETATKEDFFAVSTDFIALRDFFSSYQEVLLEWNLTHYLGDTFFDIELFGATTMDHIYRVSCFEDKSIAYISHRGEQIYEAR